MEWANEAHIDLTKSKIAVAQFAGPIGKWKVFKNGHYLF